MKNKQVTILILSIFIILITSACSGRTSIASGWGGVIVDGETAYLAINNHVYGIDINTGRQRWSYPTETDAKISFYSSPVMTDDGQLIVGGYDNILYSLNPANGQLNWQFTGATNKYIASPLVSEHGIFASSADQNLYALDFDGTTLWPEFETEKPLWSTPSLGIDCDCIIFSSMDHMIYSVDIKTGNLLWKSDDLGGAIVGTPVVGADNKVYVGNFDNKLIAYDTKLKRIDWEFPTQDWVWSSPVIDGNLIYFGDISGIFYAVNLLTGTQEWQIQANGSIVSPPAIQEDGLFFTSEDGIIYSITRDGVIRWSFPLETNLYASPVSVGDMILVPTSQTDTPMIALDSNGTQRWIFTVEK